MEIEKIKRLLKNNYKINQADFACKLSHILNKKYYQSTISKMLTGNRKITYTEMQAISRILSEKQLNIDKM